jgi:glycosyltransferase involved in cell wall biosynthesis
LQLSIIIPCYNEKKNIPLILERFKNVINRKDIEVILVDNGSNDNSSEVLNELIPKYSFAKTVKVEVNKGYGFGILSGLKTASGEYIGWTHADMQTDPYDPIKALEIIEKKGCPKNIYIKGKRKGRSFFDLFFTMGMSFFETVYLKKRLWDINAQPNIFHSSFYRGWGNPPHDFSLDLYALYQAKINNLEITRFEVLFPKRLHGQSSWNTGLKAKWKFIKRTADFSKKLKKELKK